MSRPLIYKELREHGVLLAIAGSLAAVALFGLLRTSEFTAGRFHALHGFALGVTPLLALLLSNRLFAHEYASRTQLFLEVLPVSRTRVFITKWLLGAGLFLATVGAAWFATLVFIRRTEVIQTPAALATLGCVALYALTLWSFAALAGMLGRYRYFLWIFGLLGLIASLSITGLDVHELPVLRLLGDDVIMARTELTAEALLIPAMLIVLCSAAAAALALHGSGAIASMLAQRMTAREVSFVVIALMSLLTLVGSLEPKPVKPKFALSSGEVVTQNRSSAAVLPTGDFDAAAAQSLARIIANDVDSLITALALPASSSVYIMPQQGLDPDAMQRAALNASDGIVIKAAPDAPQDALRALVLHSLLGDHTLGRGFKEDRHILLDGLASYWTIKDDAQRRAVWWLRVAATPAMDARQLSHWSQTAEQLGDCLSQGVAFGVIDTLVSELGRERMLQLLRPLFVRPHDDVRALFERSPETLLASAGLSWQALASKLAGARSSARNTHAAQLQQRARITATLDWKDDRKRGLTVAVNVQGTSAYRVLYGQLGPWTADVGNLARLDARTERAVLPISPPRGARVLAAVETDDAVLGCPVRVLARRVTLR